MATKTKNGKAKSHLPEKGLPDTRAGWAEFRKLPRDEQRSRLAYLQVELSAFDREEQPRVEFYIITADLFRKLKTNAVADVAYLVDPMTEGDLDHCSFDFDDGVMVGAAVELTNDQYRDVLSKVLGIKPKTDAAA